MTDDEHALFKSALLAESAVLGVDLSTTQISLLQRFRCLVIDANQQFNLTRIVDSIDFAVRHVADSLAPLAWLRTQRRNVRHVLDIGTGAGAPAIPLAIAKPEWSITAIDGTRKKSEFVRTCGRELALTNLCSHHQRAESWKSPNRFDLVLMRAVGPVDRCLRYARPHVDNKGAIILYKSATLAKEELNAGKVAADALNYEALPVFAYTLNMNGVEPIMRKLCIYRPDTTKISRS